MTQAVAREWVDMNELDALLKEIKPGLREDQYHTLELAVETLQFVSDALRDERITATKLRKMLFGPTTGKTANVLGKKNDESEETCNSSDEDDIGESPSDPDPGEMDVPSEDDEPETDSKERKRKTMSRKPIRRNGNEKVTAGTASTSTRVRSMRRLRLIR